MSYRPTNFGTNLEALSRKYPNSFEIKVKLVDFYAQVTSVRS